MTGIIAANLTKRFMPTFPLRIRFLNEDVAYRCFNDIPPDNLDYIQGYSAKRDGDSKVILLTLTTEENLHDFIALCRRESSIREVTPITEEEFWRAKSNAI
jgi:hypothetical protein